MSLKGINVKEEFSCYHTGNGCLDKEIRLVLLGKTGCGKSATGNSILGSEKFKAKLSGSSVTRVCSQNSAVRFNRKIVIVDTPGIFDTEETNEKVQEEIYKCIGITSPGPHAFILVLNIVERFTEEEERTVEHFVKYFGENVYKYLIVVFTRKDELKTNNTTLENHIKSCPSKLQKFIQRCGNRVSAFDNNLHGVEQDKQVKELMHVILKNVTENGGKFYTNEMYIEAEQKIRAFEEDELRKDEEQSKQVVKTLAHQFEELTVSPKQKTKEEDKMRKGTEASEKDPKTSIHEPVQGVNELKIHFERLSSKEKEYESENVFFVKKIKEESHKCENIRRKTNQNDDSLHEHLGEKREGGLDKTRASTICQRESVNMYHLPGNHVAEIKQELEKKILKREEIRDKIRRKIENKDQSMSWQECTIL